MSGSHSMKGKHSWLHFVNYLIYASIPLTMISCSWDRFWTCNQGGSQPTPQLSRWRCGSAASTFFKNIYILQSNDANIAKLLPWLLYSSPGSCCSSNCELSQCEFRAGVLVPNVHRTWPGARFLGADCLQPLRHLQKRRPHAKVPKPLENPTWNGRI